MRLGRSIMMHWKKWTRKVVDLGYSYRLLIYVIDLGYNRSCNTQLFNHKKSPFIEKELFIILLIVIHI
jgi:hypothetical protein